VKKHCGPLDEAEGLHSVQAAKKSNVGLKSSGYALELRTLGTVADHQRVQRGGGCGAQTQGETLALDHSSSKHGIRRAFILEPWGGSVASRFGVRQGNGGKSNFALPLEPRGEGDWQTGAQGASQFRRNEEEPQVSRQERIDDPAANRGGQSE